MTDSPLAMVTVAGTKFSSPPSPPSFTVAALAEKVSTREAAPARATPIAFCATSNGGRVSHHSREANCSPAARRTAVRVAAHEPPRVCGADSQCSARAAQDI